MSNAHETSSDAALLIHGFDPKTDTDADGLVPCGMQWSPQV